MLNWFRKNPRSFGFDTELWTARCVAQVIERKWGVHFNSRYLNAWLRVRKITTQKPQRVPREADRAAIESWRTHDRHTAAVRQSSLFGMSGHDFP